jgi:hypothetical protein
VILPAHANELPRDPAVTIRLTQSVLDDVEAWSKSQEDEPARSQAIRRLVEIGLNLKGPSKLGRMSRARERRRRSTGQSSCRS